MLGIEIDLKNLEWFNRFKDFYDVPTTQLKQYLIAKGNNSDIPFFQSIDKTKSSQEILEKIVGKNKVEQLTRINDKNRIAFLEKILFTVMLSEASKAFTGFPFTISILWGYRVFLKFETKNLFSIIQSKAYQLKKDDVLHYLVI